MISEPIAVSMVSAVSGIAIAYIVNVVSKRVQQKKAKDGPIDRMEQMFDGYERLIKQKDIEDERKAVLIAELKEELMAARKMVIKLERDLEVSRNENLELIELLSNMRQEYKESMKEQNNVETSKNT